MTKFFVKDCTVQGGRGQAIASIILENGDTRDIYGKKYSDDGKWIGDRVCFGPEYCYFANNGEVWRRKLDILDFGVYPPDHLSVDEEPAYYKKITEWEK